jgi:hypothetical protein
MFRHVHKGLDMFIHVRVDHRASSSVPLTATTFQKYINLYKFHRILMFWTNDSVGKYRMQGPIPQVYTWRVNKKVSI